VDAPPPEVQPFGLTRERLEAALREGLGDRVGETGSSRDIARLRLRMNVTLYGFYSWSLQLQVHRAVTVVGQEGAYTLTQVWSAGELGGTLLPPEVRRLEGVARRLGEELRRALAD